ncbi:hypothetical protein FRC06_008988 [Ceratobasidium sp. 370]|nr:hypothetical protein FRC06_008988 [Ceratobasidium sp. 370]
MSSHSLPLVPLPLTSSTAKKGKCCAQPLATLLDVVTTDAPAMLPAAPAPVDQLASDASTLCHLSTSHTPTQTEATLGLISTNPVNLANPPNPPNMPNQANLPNPPNPPNQPSLLDLLSLLSLPSLPNLPNPPATSQLLFTSNQYTELLRHLNVWEQQELVIASECAKNEAWADAAKVKMLQFAQRMAEAKLSQCMHLECLQAALKDVALNVSMYNSAMTAQHGMVLSTAATLPSTHPLYEQANNSLQDMM